MNNAMFTSSLSSSSRSPHSHKHQESEENHTTIRDFAYKQKPKPEPEPKPTQTAPLQVIIVETESSLPLPPPHRLPTHPHPHPLRSNPDPRSKYGLLLYRDRSITVTTPEANKVTWVPKGQLVPPATASTPLKRGREREGLWEGIKRLLGLGMGKKVRREEKRKMGNGGGGTKVYVTGRRPSLGFLKRVKNMFRKFGEGDVTGRESEVAECRICRSDGTRGDHENHRISPPRSELSNKNGEPLNPLAGKTTQYARFVHERAGGLIASSFVGTPSLESSRSELMQSLEDLKSDHEPSPEPTQQIGELDSAVGGRRSIYVGRDTSDDGGNLKNIHSNNWSKKRSSLLSTTSTSTSTSSEITHLLSQVLPLPNQQQFDEMTISNLELAPPSYPEAYAKLREGQKEALLASLVPLPASISSSTDDLFRWDSKTTIEDALRKWSTEPTPRSILCRDDEESDAEEQFIDKPVAQKLIVQSWSVTPFNQLEQKLQDAIDSSLHGITIPRPNSADIDKRRKEMNRRLQEPFHSLNSEDSLVTSNPSPSITIRNLDSNNSNKGQDVVVGSPFVDVHQEYLAHPSSSFPKSSTSPNPIGYPGLDSSATLSEFGFHPTIDTMPGSWKQQWEMLDGDDSSEEEAIEIEDQKTIEQVSTLAEEHSPFTMDDDIERSEPILIRMGRDNVRIDNVQQTASQFMLSRCTRIPGSFEESPNNSEYNVSTF